MADADHRPRTVSGVREQHLSLMTGWRALPDDQARHARAEALREAVRDAGHDIAAPAERDEAQGIIDYWASSIAGLPGQSYPEILTLAPYSGAAADRAAHTAAEVFAALGSEEERLAARRVFEELVEQRDGGFERGRAQTRAALGRRVRDPALDGVLERFERTGAITRLPGETPEDDRFELSDARVVDEWPELRGWLAERREFDEACAGVMAQAERWRDAGFHHQALAPDAQAETLERFRGQTALVDRFIDASRERGRTRARTRVRLATLATTLAVIFGLMSLWLWWANGKISSLTDDLTKEVAEAQTSPEVAEVPRDVAETTVGNLAPEPASALAGAAPPPGLAGALWLGSTTRSQVRPESRGAPAISPDRAVDGTRFRVPAGIVLRTDVPDPDGAYLSKPKKALVPAGSLVVVRGSPQAYERPSGTQYWARVAVVPRVYIQHHGGDPQRVERLRAAVAAAGFDVPPAERIASAGGLRQVRWSHRDDRAAAEQLVKALGDPAGAALARVECVSLESARRRNAAFILELWVDFDAPPPARPRPC